MLACGMATLWAGENLKSGPQTGQKVPGPFEPLNVTGPSAGEKSCLYCRNGANPVVMIFAREISEPLTQLIKKVDAATSDHQDTKMGSFVVFLGDSEELSPRLKQLADKEQIKQTVLSVHEQTGPKAYKVSPEADVTVVLYTNHEVKANHAFARGELQEKDIDTIMQELPKILTPQ
jgi:hypothetical protein